MFLTRRLLAASLALALGACADMGHIAPQAALADAHYGKCLAHIEHYQTAVQSGARALLAQYDKVLSAAPEAARTARYLRASIRGDSP